MKFSVAGVVVIVQEGRWFGGRWEVEVVVSVEWRKKGFSADISCNDAGSGFRAHSLYNLINS